MCACSRERQFVRKHNCPVNRFIYLSQKSVQRKDQKCEREERKNQRVGRQKKTIHPLCTPSFASSSHSFIAR